MKNVFLKIFLLIIILTFFLFVTCIYTTSAATKYACVLSSTELGGIQSEQDEEMLTAKLAYSNRGYSTFNLKDPSLLNILSNAASSQVQLYYCHGNPNYVKFLSGGLCKGPSRTIDEREYYSLSTVDWTDKKLIIFAGCKTAGNGSSDSSSIAAEIVSYYGSQMSIGWYTTIFSLSTPNWLNNFHEKISQGYDPLVATNYANGESYGFPSVKNTLVSYRSLSALSEEPILSIQSINNESIIEINSNEISNIYQAENKIQEINPEFNLNDYTQTVSDGLYVYDAETDSIQHICSYVDYNYKIGDFVTNSGYTIILDENGSVQQIRDNTIEIPSSSIDTFSNDSDSFRISEETRIYYLNKAKENISEFDILNEEIRFAYDIASNKKYACVILEVEDDLGPISKSFDFEM